MLAELLRGDLVDGYAGAEVCAGGHPRVRARQPGGAGAWMVAAHFAIEARGLLIIEPGYHHHAVFEGRERLERPGQLPVATHGLGRPLVPQVKDPVRGLHERQADRPCRGGAKRRRHGVEHGQGKRSTHSAQDSAPGNRFLKEHHR